MLADFYSRRFRTEFKPAVEAWVATRPLKNAHAPLTPFAMPQYRLAAAAEAERLDAAAELSATTVQRNVQRSSNYVLGVVLFAVSLFFAGISTKLEDERLKGFTLGLGWLVFLGAAAWVATFPLSIAV
jgi:hypothetical protein